MTVQPEPTAAPEDDEALVALIAGHDHRAFEAMMRKHNGKLFRVARAILRNDAEAEDALQDAYLDAYRHIGDLRGEGPLVTWLTRIVINHAFMRLRRLRRDRVVVPFGERPTEDGGLEPDQVEAVVADETV
jgi:RNA polymerase sigma factor (sigma-70 family)